jgi:hypothetical protein
MTPSLCVIVFGLCLVTADVDASSFRRPGSQREAVEGRQSNNAPARGRTTSDDDQARAERNAHYEAKRQEANAAWEREDWREMLRLLYEVQKLRDGPKVRASIAGVKAVILEVEAQERQERDRRATELRIEQAHRERAARLEQDRQASAAQANRDMQARKALDERLRIDRNAKVNKYQVIDRQGIEAWDKRDYHAALRLYESQDPTVDATHLRSRILETKAIIAWEAARTAAEARRAIAIWPKLFTQDELRYVHELETKEKYERERPAREAEDLKVAKALRANISELASTLTFSPTSVGVVLARGETVAEYLGGHMAAPLAFGDPNAPESFSDLGRSGFDRSGPHMGSRQAVEDVVLTEESESPQAAAVEQELLRLNNERALMESRIARLTHDRNAALGTETQKRLTAALDRLNLAKQEKLMQIFERSEKRESLRRTISVERAKGSNAKPN